MKARLSRQFAGLAVAGALVVGGATLAVGSAPVAAPVHVQHHSQVIDEADTHWPCHGCP